MGVRQWVPAFLLSDPTKSEQQQRIVLAPPPPTNPDLRLLDSAPDCFERLADGCCFRTTCCSSCDATTILEKQRKNGNFKRADAPTALASRIKVFSALGLWFTAFAFLLVLAIMGTSMFSDAADIVTFSMGMLPVVLPIIPLAVAVHQFSKGRWARRAPGCCCSLGATTFPFIAGSLHNYGRVLHLCHACLGDHDVSDGCQGRQRCGAVRRWLRLRLVRHRVACEH